MRRTVQDDTGRIMVGVVAVESELQWQTEDTGARVPPAEPARLG
jgi:hypothetical protein